MNLVSIVDRNILNAFFAIKLMEVGQKSDVWIDFQMRNDVSYIASLLTDFVFCKDFDPNLLVYQFIRLPSLEKGEVFFDQVLSFEPVVMREIADISLLSLGFFNRFPKFISGISTPNQLSFLYAKVGKIYPEESFRQHLISMSDNVFPWIEVLPKLKKQMNLVISR